MKFIINLIIIVLVLAAIYFGIQFALSKKAPQEAVGIQGEVVRTGTSTTGTIRTTSVRTEDFLALLNMAQSINFKSALFDDEAFLGLENFQQPLPTRAVGRINPFAPLNQTDDTPKKTATSTKKATNR